MSAADEWKEQGNAAFQAGDYQKAVDFYTNGVELEPRNRALFSNRSAAYLKIEDYAKAKLDARICIDLDKTWPKVSLSRFDAVRPCGREAPAWRTGLSPPGASCSSLSDPRSPILFCERVRSKSTYLLRDALSRRLPQGWWRLGVAQMEDKDYQAAKATFKDGLVHCKNDENLIQGAEKAQKYIDVMASVQGGSEEPFDLDSPSQKPAQPAPVAQPNGTSTGGASSSSRPPTEDVPFPGTAEQEIARIKGAPNHYAVLHVSPDASNAQLKKNYYTLARILHPDKCQLPGAEDAMTDVSLAYDTLTNVIKKTLYDQYMSQTGEGEGEGDNKPQTYAEWEARQQPMELPKWLAVLLSTKRCGWFLAVIIALILLPIIVIVFVVFLIMWVLLLPYRLTLRFCFPEKYEQMKEEREKDLAKMEEEAQDRMFAHV